MNTDVESFGTWLLSKVPILCWRLHSEWKITLRSTVFHTNHITQTYTTWNNTGMLCYSSVTQYWHMKALAMIPRRSECHFLECNIGTDTQKNDILYRGRINSSKHHSHFSTWKIVYLFFSFLLEAISSRGLFSKYSVPIAPNPFRHMPWKDYIFLLYWCWI